MYNEGFMQKNLFFCFSLAKKALKASKDIFKVSQKDNLMDGLVKKLLLLGAGFFFFFSYFILIIKIFPQKRNTHTKKKNRPNSRMKKIKKCHPWWCPLFPLSLLFSKKKKGESGKSTLFKQMITLYGKGYDEEERAGFACIVYNNAISSMKVFFQISSSLSSFFFFLWNIYLLFFFFFCLIKKKHNEKKI